MGVDSKKALEVEAHAGEMNYRVVPRLFYSDNEMENWGNTILSSSTFKDIAIPLTVAAIMGQDYKLSVGKCAL